MLAYVADLVKDLKVKDAIFVLGHKHAQVKSFLNPGAKVVIQKRLMGTGDAVGRAAGLLKNFKGTVLVLCADIPLLKKETLKKLIDYHLKNNLDATVLTAQLDKPTGYGRILRDKYASICGIAEEKDADDFQKEIKEINTGVICFNKQRLFAGLKYIRLNKRKKEYYLTDLFGIFYKQGHLTDNVNLPDINEALGINSRLDLARANSVMQQRINTDLMEKGITIVDPGSTFISHGTRIGADCVIYPFTVIEKNVRIGKRCRIGPFAHLREGIYLKDDTVAGENVSTIRRQDG